MISSLWLSIQASRSALSKRQHLSRRTFRSRSRTTFFLKLSRVRPQYAAASSRLNTRFETGASSLILLATAWASASTLMKSVARVPILFVLRVHGRLLLLAGFLPLRRLLQRHAEG